MRRPTHGADRAPTPEEEAAAERNPDVPPESAEAYEEAIERGADVRGRRPDRSLIDRYHPTPCLNSKNH